MDPTGEGLQCPSDFSAAQQFFSSLCLYKNDTPSPDQKKKKKEKEKLLDMALHCCQKNKYSFTFFVSSFWMFCQIARYGAAVIKIKIHSHFWYAVSGCFDKCRQFLCKKVRCLLASYQTFQKTCKIRNSQSKDFQYPNSIRKAVLKHRLWAFAQSDYSRLVKGISALYVPSKPVPGYQNQTQSLYSLSIGSQFGQMVECSFTN